MISKSVVCPYLPSCDNNDLFLLMIALLILRSLSATICNEYTITQFVQDFDMWRRNTKRQLLDFCRLVAIRQERSDHTMTTLRSNARKTMVSATVSRTFMDSSATSSRYPLRMHTNYTTHENAIFLSENCW